MSSNNIKCNTTLNAKNSVVEVAHGFQVIVYDAGHRQGTVLDLRQFQVQLPHSNLHTNDMVC
jgi:hypothetical protein